MFGETPQYGTHDQTQYDSEKVEEPQKQVFCGGIKSHCFGLFSGSKKTFWILGGGDEEQCVGWWRLYL
jgi:hypothetical protein